MKESEMIEDNTELEQAKLQVAGIVEMVKALEVDYERLEKLRAARQELRKDFDSMPENVGYDFDYWSRNQDLMTSEDCDELRALEAAAGDCKSQDEARARIDESPLSVEVRSDWYSVHSTDPKAAMPAEFRIVLCTGGPHVEIQGELDEHNEPVLIRVLYSNWGSSGELHDFDYAAVQTYCQQFWFGE